jgi:hypothetical protein
MIAVFSQTESDYRFILELTPSKMFIRIRDVNDIRGRTFTGIVRTYRWWLNKEAEYAYDVLRTRQPELFD